MKTLQKSKIKITAFICCLFLTVSFSSNAQKSKNAVFYQANIAMQNAKLMQADILAPNEYAKALESYQDANKDFDNKKGIDNIEATLVDAVNFFNRSADFSVSAKIIFANSLNAREDALSAGSNKYAKELWLNAEEQFIIATKELEDGNRDDSYNESVKAVEMYRKAELAAIKTNLLDETRALLLKADETKVDRNAPKTLTKSKTLLAETEKALETNRYDMDYPRILAKQAKYEAKHAIFINETIKKANEENTSQEELILSSETPFIKIAETIGFVAQFDEGPETTENEIIDYIMNLQAKNTSLMFENTKKDNLIVDLVANINLLKDERTAMNAEFQKEIGKRSDAMKSNMQAFENEKAALDKKIKYQENMNEKFDIVYLLFDSTEATVYRSGNDVIVRMNGFDFDIGKSEIKPAYFSLLTKVQSAINTFPNSKVTVEGYTDSFGSDIDNQKLSQNRSDAVTKYLLANMSSLKKDHVSSVGHGENSPLANNETIEGRRQNRRIDIIIKPSF